MGARAAWEPISGGGEIGSGLSWAKPENRRFLGKPSFRKEGLVARSSEQPQRLRSCAGRLGTKTLKNSILSEWRDARRQKIGVFGLVVEGPTWNDLGHSFQVLDLFQVRTVRLAYINGKRNDAYGAQRLMACHNFGRRLGG